MIQREPSVESLPGSLSLGFVESLYASYQRDPASVSLQWRRYFASLGDGAAAVRLGPSFRPASVFNPAGAVDTRAARGARELEMALLQDRVDQLVRAYRVRGHLVARIDREVVGYGGLICYGEEAHVTNVAVDPERQREKIGTRVLHDLIMAAVDMNAEAVSLEVRVTNWGAQRLYARFGFRPVGIRKNYYQEIGEDALIMWLDGIRTPEFRARIRRVIGELPEGIRPSDT